ncbi:hypothetical protein RM545_12320 [Zunongwangia sp. F260]|uniref:DNA-binding protein n=1 Tax=Autumnicola lenta TaxID=3075593 RepID=A0ABU3CM95_9FLAO|nr:hypothetical protein [Zunongwangia sp. F260]MDT0647478.1 hypothetical protein [Zunongwangia sp. F260]
MSLLSTKDFAELAGVKLATLRQHVRREKVVKTGNYINTEHPTNAIYLTDQWSKHGKPNMIPKETITEKPSIENIAFENTDKSIALKAADWTLRKKEADALISERRAQELYYKNQRLQGKLMPIEIVEKTMVINIQSVFRSFEASAENIASVYNERLGGDRSSLTEMITRMREELERAINTAKRKSSEEIKALMQEYSVTRSRGEKK